MKPPRLDLWADLNNEDDAGICWSAMRHARDPASVVPGARLIVGSETFWGVAEIVAVDGDGMVHFRVLRPSDPDSKRVLAETITG